jgi:hypothetical protein
MPLRHRLKRTTPLSKITRQLIPYSRNKSHAAHIEHRQTQTNSNHEKPPSKTLYRTKTACIFFLFFFTRIDSCRLCIPIRYPTRSAGILFFSRFAFPSGSKECFFISNYQRVVLDLLPPFIMLLPSLFSMLCPGLSDLFACVVVDWVSG